MDNKTKNELRFKEKIKDYRKLWTREFFENKISLLSPNVYSITLEVVVAFESFNTKDVLYVLKDHIKTHFPIADCTIYEYFGSIYIDWGPKKYRNYCSAMIINFFMLLLTAIILLILVVIGLPFLHDVFILPIKAGIGGVKTITPEYCQRYGYGYC
jgi:hypothetical protein